MNTFLELYSYRSVLGQLVRQQLVLRYRRTILGYLWTLINPLLTMSITAIVFSSILGMDLKSYVVYLFSGLMAWNCFNAIATQSSGVYISNESLIKKIYLPKLIFPLSQSFAVLIDSFLSFLAIYIIIYCITLDLSSSVLFIPIAYIILFTFSLGVALVFSVATVFFRDLQYVISIAMQAWYFLTPVMYKANGVSKEVATLIQLNPVTPFVEMFQDLLFFNQMPEKNLIIECCIYAFVSMLFGIIVFNKSKNLLIYRL